LIDATQTADRYPYELRTMLSSDRRYAVNDCINLGVYTPLQTARFSAANILSLLNGWTVAQVPARDSLIATASAYEGYSLVLLGEGFCTMVVSGLDANRQVVYGGEISRDSVFRLAVVAFSDAIAGGNADIVNMARVGRARAYLDLGQPTLVCRSVTRTVAVLPAFPCSSRRSSRRCPVRSGSRPVTRRGSSPRKPTSGQAPSRPQTASSTSSGRSAVRAPSPALTPPRRRTRCSTSGGANCSSKGSTCSSSSGSARRRLRRPARPTRAAGCTARSCVCPCPTWRSKTTRTSRSLGTVDW